MSITADDILTRHRLSVADFHRMGEAGLFREDDRVELIEGDLVDMTPIGSAHGGAVNRLSKLFILAAGDRAVVSTQNPVVLGERSEPEPDLALLRPSPDFYAAAHPGLDDIRLLIEVADTSLRYDTEIKVPLYARHNVPELWLVDLINEHLVLHRSPSAGTYAEVSVAATLEEMRPLLLPNIAVDLRELFSHP